MKQKTHLNAFFISCLGLIISLFSFTLHPFHVSSTEILYGNEHTLEINTRIFTDDFESLLSRIYKKKIDLSNPKMHKEMDTLVERYIRDAFKLKADQKNLKMNYLGYEINREATQIYLESEKLNTPRSIRIENKIMYQLFDDQNNIVHIIVNKQRKSEQTQFPKTTLEQTF